MLKGFGAVPPLVTDIDLSMDDRFLYVSCWGTGDLQQYDVSDPFNPKLTGKVRIGGIASRASHPRAKNGHLTGGPQMVEISRDGRRVYFTNSLYGAIDRQFYHRGFDGWMVKLDADPDGGISFDEELLHRVAQGTPAASDPARRRRLLFRFLLLSMMPADTEGGWNEHGIIQSLALDCSCGSRRIPWTESGHGMAVCRGAWPPSPEPGHCASGARSDRARSCCGGRRRSACRRGFRNGSRYRHFSVAALVLFCWDGLHGMHSPAIARRLRIGMQTGWWASRCGRCMMASAHGAGLMLVPAVLSLCVSHGMGGELGASDLHPDFARGSCRSHRRDAGGHRSDRHCSLRPIWSRIPPSRLDQPRHPLERGSGGRWHHPPCRLMSLISHKSPRVLLANASERALPVRQRHAKIRKSPAWRPFGSTPRRSIRKPANRTSA